MKSLPKGIFKLISQWNQVSVVFFLISFFSLFFFGAFLLFYVFIYSYKGFALRITKLTS